MVSSSTSSSEQAGATSSSIFQLKGVTKRFGNVPVLEGIDFTLRSGEVHALIGENGAGKSTLMKIVSGLYRPDEGTLEVEGQPVNFSSPQQAEAAGIAMIPQEPNLFLELSVAENLFVGRSRPRLKWGGLDWSAMQNEARRRFEMLGVDLDATALVKQLSPANRQIVAIARALMGGAKAVIMDEPTTSLSGREVERLFQIISDLKARGTGIVYISHRIEEIFSIADRITVLRDGQLIETRPTSEFDTDELVRLMVGRPLKELFSRSEKEVKEVVLELRGLTRRGEFADVNLALHEGEVVGMAGLIGAGRSELAQAIFGLRSLDAGQILITGEEVKIRSPQDAFAHGLFYVPEERQSQGLILPFPIEANISLSSLDQFSHLGFIQAEKEHEAAVHSVQTLSIRGAEVSDPTANLSGGNQQKVVLAKALTRRPSILLLDEPTRGIDIGARSEIYHLIDQLTHDGLAILLISSDLEEVLSMSDRIIVMHEGRISGAFSKEEATQEKIIAAATGVSEQASSNVLKEREL